MRILILTQWFDPEPTMKGLSFAKKLVAAGHSVEVITGFPNYPGGKLYPGYRVKWLQRENIDGIRITRVPLFPSHSRSRLGRIANYLSFAASAAIFGIFRAGKVDVAYVYHPPLTVGIAASLIRLFRRIPFVYDIQDLWPDTLSATGMVNSQRILTCVQWVCGWVYSSADLLIAQSPGFQERLLSRGVPTEKIRLIYNWCDESALSERAPPSALTEKMVGKFNVVFAGGIGIAQGLDNVLLAAMRLKNSNRRIQFIFVGSGTDKARLQDKARELELDNLIFHDHVPMNQVGGLLELADVLLVHLKPDPIFQFTIPSKIQAYLFLGKPVLCAVGRDAEQLIEKANAGKWIAPGDPDALASAVLSLANTPEQVRDAMGFRGKAFYQKEMSFDAGVTKILSALEDAYSNSAIAATKEACGS